MSAPFPHLITSAGWSFTRLSQFLSLAQACRTALDSGAPKCWPVLQGKTVVNLFWEPSTRTRSSFELAARYLGAHVLNFEGSSSSVSKGETLFDTVDSLLQMGVDAFVVRHREDGLHQRLVDTFGAKTAVLNAGEGVSDHPTQALLDVLTLTQQVPLEALKDKKLAIVGDIKHSRVAQANLSLLQTVGIDVHCAGPEGLLSEATAQQFNCPVHRDLAPALKDADFVMTLRLQKERQEQGVIESLEQFTERFQLNHTTLERYAPPHVKLLHPGPVNREVELSSALMDDPAISLIREQVRNGLAVRMAALLVLLHPQPYEVTWV